MTERALALQALLFTASGPCLRLCWQWCGSGVQCEGEVWLEFCLRVWIMTEAPLIASAPPDLPPEWRALNVEGRDFQPNSTDPSPLVKVLCCLLALLCGGSAVASAAFILPGLVMLPMAFDAPGSDKDPRVYISLIGMVTLPCSLALSAYVACRCMYDVRLQTGYMRCLLALPIVNVLMMIVWT